MPDRRPSLALFTAADRDVLQRAFDITNRVVAQAIADGCARVHMPEPGRWLDTRPMLDPRECSGAAIDLAAQYLSYADAAGLVQRHSVERHLVRIITAYEAPR